jgi:hypothetical protein
MACESTNSDLESTLKSQYNQIKSSKQQDIYELEQTLEEILKLGQNKQHVDTIYQIQKCILNLQREIHDSEQHYRYQFQQNQHDQHQFQQIQHDQQWDQLIDEIVNYQRQQSLILF